MNIHKYTVQYPLQTMLFTALLIRLLGAFLSKGYTFHDDHFCVITVAQAWTDGIPYWLELWKETGETPLHSELYVLLHQAVFEACEALGVYDPQTKMLIIRLFHALYSLLVVYLGYKITLLIADKKTALTVGWTLTLVWFMPLMSVRNLVEMVSIPFCMTGFYLLIYAHQNKEKNKEKSNYYGYYLLAGLVFGLAFAFRFHTILFAGGLGLVLLFRQYWIGSILFSIGYLLAAFASQGCIDWYLLSYPFESVVGYFAYNAANAYNYVTLPFYTFFFTILLFLVPPISGFLMFGYGRSFKKEPMMFTAILVFFLLHSYFPNKQERFILPMLPLLVILGVVGWQEWVQNSRFWQQRIKLHQRIWYFFWGLNIIASIFLVTNYNKKSRIEPLYYLSQYNNVESVLMESCYESIAQLPTFYFGKPCMSVEEHLSADAGRKKFSQEKKFTDPHFCIFFMMPEGKTMEDIQKDFDYFGKKPNYLVMIGTKNIEERMQKMKTYFPDMSLLTVISPSVYDRILYTLNPYVHRNETSYIFALNKK